jgi:hypothetical protein
LAVKKTEKPRFAGSGGLGPIIEAANDVLNIARVLQEFYEDPTR